MKALLEVHQLSKSFLNQEVPAVDSLSFNLSSNEILALLGPSGCGKTTTLRMIAGFETLDSGSIRFEDRLLADQNQFVRSEHRNIGFVFQEPALFPHLRVRENIGFGLKKMKRQARLTRIKELVELFKISGLESRKPHQLSGGQQQRVALARALAPAPKLVLLDEPFSHLDVSLRREFRTELRELLKQLEISAILVTHDHEEALSMADRVGVMNRAQLEQLGNPEQIYQQPATSFVAKFVGRSNLLEVEAKGKRAESILGLLSLDRECYGKKVVSIRPEHLELKPNLETNAQIIRREFQGATCSYCIQVGEQELYANLSSNHNFSVGDFVTVSTTQTAIVSQTAQ